MVGEPHVRFSPFSRILLTSCSLFSDSVLLIHESKLKIERNVSLELIFYGRINSKLLQPTKKRRLEKIQLPTLFPTLLSRRHTNATYDVYTWLFRRSFRNFHHQLFPPFLVVVGVRRRKWDAHIQCSEAHVENVTLATTDFFFTELRNLVTKKW